MLLYFTIYLVVTLTIALKQPHYDTPPLKCNPPDEHARYLVSLYICNYGILPTGYEEELFSGDCKWTYGFYTLLPYMVQGYVMRFVHLFTDSSLILLYTARMVDVIFGLVTAYIVLLLGRKLWKDDRERWLFCFLVTFLPQSIFLHTYANPDSLCLLSTALMLYGLTRGYGDCFSVGSCGFLTAGIVLCALTYYNAYGFILGSVVLFAVYFWRKEEGRWRCEWDAFLKKGTLISVVVFLCVSWSFFRNYILYDGDFIGLTTMQNLIKSLGIPRETYYSQGKSLFFMLFGTTFLPKLAVSFIANYGSATIYTWKIIYIFYLVIFGAGMAGLFFFRKGQEKCFFCEIGDAAFPKLEKWQEKWIHVVMFFCMIMPFLLLVRYAYTVDYQAQGRYVMPALIPAMYYITRGLGRLALSSKGLDDKKEKCFAAVMVGIVVSLLITVYFCALPCYLQHTVL